MSPSPFAVSSPTDPASYSWEATDEGVAERFGIPVSEVLRFDLNTSPAPPALVAGLLAAGRFETTLSEYPPGDYRHLVEAAASVYGVATDELVPGRRGGRDPGHVHQGLPARRRGGRDLGADLPDVPDPRRAARRPGDRRPAPGPGRGLGHGRGRGPRGRARGGARVDLQPEQSDGPPRARRIHRVAARGRPARTRPRTGARCPRWSSTRPTASSPAGRVIALRASPPQRGRRADRVARRTRSRDCGSGSRSRLPTRCGGSRCTVRRARSAPCRRRPSPRPCATRRGCARTSIASHANGPGSIAGARGRRVPAAALGDQLRAPGPRDARASRGRGAGAHGPGLVPRTFGHGHPLAYCLRVTVRTPDDDDRLIAAATEIAPTLPPIPATDGDAAA